ncbi:MAG TPA: Gfo/Idh/MocA family oxidoreductase [Spirochaetia bacterium]|nr:Gfo/Idh/MocA family oxidoreductase [Spirochaetia bacterium]
MKPVVWGILSVSTHYKLRIHTNLVKSPLVDMRGIASRSRDRAAEAARDLGLQKAYGSYEELLADKEIEAVYIPLPNHMHAEWVKKAADAGKHVLCEKPFAMDAQEAEQAVRHAERKGVLVMEAFMYRFHPQWKRAREIVRSGEIGDVRSVNTIFSYMLTDPTNIRNVLSSGGGAIPDIGCYAVSSARFLVGREPTRVVSLVHRDPKLKTDILTSGILDFGVARSIFTVGTQSYPWQRVEVLGSGGELSVQIPFNPFPDVPMQVVVTTGVGTRTYLSPTADQYVEMFEPFSRAVREGGPVPTPPQDAIDNMKVLDALFRSEKSGGWEQVG